MIGRRSLLAGALAAGLPAALPRRARAAEPGLLRIGYQKNGILVIAKQQGVIEARLKPLGYAVKWVEFSLGPPLLEALGLGGIDLGQTGDAPPIFAQAAGADLVYAAAQEAAGTGSGILVPKGSPLRTIADLKGKRLGFAKGTSAHNLAVATLEKAGLSYADVEPVILAPADAAAAFARGSLDAWSIWDPYFAIAEGGDGVRVLSYATDVARPNIFFLANRGFAQARPDVLGEALDVLDGVARWAEANRGSVAAILAQGTGVPLAATRRAVDRANYRIGPLTPQVVAEQQSVADRFHALKLIPRPIRVADVVWTPPARNG